MTYVDLNPVRADVVAAPEPAEHVSFRRRFDRARSERAAEVFLAPVAGIGPALGVGEGEYFKLVDETGGRLHPGKRGDRSIDAAHRSTAGPVARRLVASGAGRRVELCVRSVLLMRWSKRLTSCDSDGSRAWSLRGA
jgi:hypothetical protein